MCRSLAGSLEDPWYPREVMTNRQTNRIFTVRLGNGPPALCHFTLSFQIYTDSISPTSRWIETQIKAGIVFCLRNPWWAGHHSDRWSEDDLCHKAKAATENDYHYFLHKRIYAKNSHQSDLFYSLRSCLQVQCQRICQWASPAASAKEQSCLRSSSNWGGV